MPRKPKSPCCYSGCPQLVEGRFCEEHQKLYWKCEVAPRREKIAFYDTAGWKRVRTRFLKVEPLCRECLKHGVTTAAVLVDHIIPIEQNGHRFKKENLQPLCSLCHQKKRAFEAGLAMKGLTYADLK
jgi:5-methylcytosine-specific restriction protein A